MANQAINNLHRSVAEFKDSNLVKGIQEKISEISSKLPDLLGRIDLSTSDHVKKLKQNFLRRIDKRRKKFKLALESLGWGSIVELLEQAFCGKELDVWV